MASMLNRTKAMACVGNRKPEDIHSDVAPVTETDGPFLGTVRDAA